MAPGTALGFFWALGVAAERRELYRFSTDMGKLALSIADKHGSTGEKCRALVLFCAMVSGYDTVHIRSNIPRLEEAIRYGESAGDRLYQSLASIHAILTRLYICEHLSDVLVSAEECLNDVKRWGQGKDLVMLAAGVLNCIRALEGHGNAQSVQTINGENCSPGINNFDVDVSDMSSLTLSWCNSMKLVGYFCTGMIEEAAHIGFSVFESRLSHPNHRHVRYALFFHNLAMIACLRKVNAIGQNHDAYLLQIRENQTFIKKWLSASPINTSVWVSLVDAEMAALTGSSDAHKLYDMAVKLAVDHDWLLEEGFALYLQGSHFVRCGIENLGAELQRRGIARQSQWGAHGIVYVVSFMLFLDETVSSQKTSLGLARNPMSTLTKALDTLVRCWGTNRECGLDIIPYHTNIWPTQDRR
jgi:hypothetical protein